YVEGCTAPTYTTSSLHSAVVEIYVKKDAYCRYTTIQNWTDNVYNLVTKRATVEEAGKMAWIDGNIGSKLTMKYPSVLLKGDHTRGVTISIALADKDQHKDASAKMHHIEKNTSSSIVSKSISKDGRKVSYRGIVSCGRTADVARSNIECDTLIMDDISTSDTVPYNELSNDNVSLEHEAKVSKVSEEQRFHLISRALQHHHRADKIDRGFIDPSIPERRMQSHANQNRHISYDIVGESR